MIRDAKAIIFDFDGVLADSFEQIYGLNKMAMAKIGVKLSKKRYREFYMGNVHFELKQFIKDDAKYNAFSKIKAQNFSKHYASVQLFPKVKKFLGKINKKFILAVASSGNQSCIEKLLKKNNLLKNFSFILAGSDLSKDKMINFVIERIEAHSQEVTLISDTCGDIFLAKKIGLKTIGVSWGYHSLRSLRAAKPDFVARNFEELASYLIDKIKNFI